MIKLDGRCVVGVEVRIKFINDRNATIIAYILVGFLSSDREDINSLPSWVPGLPTLDSATTSLKDCAGHPCGRPIFLSLLV